MFFRIQVLIGAFFLSMLGMARLITQQQAAKFAGVTDRTIRNWTRDRIIQPYAEPFGPAPRWIRYDPAAVMATVSRMGRPCVMCGDVWEGQGDLCRSCFTTALGGPTRREDKRPTPVPPRPRPLLRVVVDAPTDTDRPDRCHFSDLPTRWCACGHAGHTGA